MKIYISNNKHIIFEIEKDSSFNNPVHFIECLQDLLDEFDQNSGAKELDSNEIGFNADRLKEFKTSIKLKLIELDFKSSCG